MQIDAKIKYGKLEKVIQAISKECTVRVGLLADKGGNEVISENLDMAGLGAVHEFGCKIPVTDKMRGFFWYKFGIHLKSTTTHIVIPSRSFLEAPISKTNKFIKKIKQNIDTDADDLMYFIEKTGDVESIARAIGGSAVDLIKEAFETSCWGEWEANKELTVDNKGSALPLVDNGYLKSRIDYDVKK